MNNLYYIMTQEEIFIKNLDNREVDELVKHFSEKYLKRKSKILDLGCGTGRHSVFLSERGHEVYALDKSKIALSKIKKTKNIKFYNENILESKFPNESFDAIISIMVLHHNTLENIKNYFKKIKFILKKEGLLCFSVLSSDDSRFNTGQKIEKGTNLNIEETFDAEIPHHFFTKNEIKKILKKYEILEIEKTSRLSAYGFKEFIHWDVIARLKEI